MNPVNLAQRSLVSAGASVIQSVGIKTLGSVAWTVGSVVYRVGFWPTVICGSILAGKTLYEYNKSEKLKESFDKGVGVFTTAWKWATTLGQGLKPQANNADQPVDPNNSFSTKAEQAAKVALAYTKDTVIGIESGFFKLAKNLGGHRDAIVVGAASATLYCTGNAVFGTNDASMLWTTFISGSVAGAYTALVDNQAPKSQLQIEVQQEEEEKKLEDQAGATSSASNSSAAMSSSSMSSTASSNL